MIGVHEDTSAAALDGLREKETSKAKGFVQAMPSTFGRASLFHPYAYLQIEPL